MSNPLTIYEFEDLLNTIYRGYYNSQYIEKLVANNFINLPLKHSEYKFPHILENNTLLESIILQTKDFSHSYYVIEYIIKYNNINTTNLIPEHNMAVLINHILFIYSNIIYHENNYSYDNSVDSVDTLKEFKNYIKYDEKWGSCFKYKRVLPYKYIQLFFYIGFKNVNLLNIYKIIDSADYKLLKMVIDKGITLNSDILEYAIKRANDIVIIYVKFPHDNYEPEYADELTESYDDEYYNMSNLYVKMCKILLDALFNLGISVDIEKNIKENKNKLVNNLLNEYKNIFENKKKRKREDSL
jgi:hypothetical protein